MWSLQKTTALLYEWKGSILLCVSNKLNYKGLVW
jgi:hypothetical protein